ncbi:MAG: COX15/CtaA family protein [Acidobacteriota bacterium]
MDNTVIKPRLSGFAKFTWFALAFNVLVIIWGVFLRASKSGDGCGEHWLTCNGELIPSAPQFKTVIEYSHRMTTAIDGLVMLVLVIVAAAIWYRSRSRQSRHVLYAAAGSLFFVITEGAVGAGLVLTGNTAVAVTDVRPFWAMGHLVNTFILLVFLTMTAWLASRERFVLRWPHTKTLVLIGIGFAMLLLVGMSGTLAALSNMLFPSTSIADGIAKDFSSSSNVIIRLRLSHPILSVLTAVYLIFLAGWLKSRAGKGTSAAWWASVLSVLLVGQVIFGAATLLTFGPIIMQLGHLFLADSVWITFVLLTANFVTGDRIGDAIE